MASQTCFVIANTLMAHYARWIEFLGGDLLSIGWVMGGGAVVGLFLRPTMGQWINRFGPITMWQIGYLLFATGALGNLAISDLGPAIYMLRSCTVLGAAVVFASGLTYISQIAPVHRQAEAIGILGVGGFLGMLVGPFLGDVFLGGEMRQRNDFSTLFITAAVGNLIPAALVLLLRRPQSSLRSRGSLRVSDFARTVYQHWPGTILFVDLAFGVCMAIPFGFLASFIDKVPLQVAGVSMMGVFFWVYAGWGLCVRITLRRVPDRFGRRKVLLVGNLFMCLGMFSYLLVTAERPWLLVIPALLTGTAHALMFHTMTALTIEPFPREVRGTGSALALMMLDLGMIAGAPILAWIGETLGFDWLFSLTAILLFTSMAAYSWSSIPVWRSRRAQ